MKIIRNSYDTIGMFDSRIGDTQIRGQLMVIPVSNLQVDENFELNNTEHIAIYDYVFFIFKNVYQSERDVYIKDEIIHQELYYDDSINNYNTYEFDFVDFKNPEYQYYNWKIKAQSFSIGIPSYASLRKGYLDNNQLNIDHFLKNLFEFDLDSITMEKEITYSIQKDIIMEDICTKEGEYSFYIENGEYFISVVCGTISWKYNECFQLEKDELELYKELGIPYIDFLSKKIRENPTPYEIRRKLKMLEKALDRNEFTKFLLGEGVYKQSSGEMDRGLHSINSSWSDVISYIKMNGENDKISIPLLDKTLTEILEKDKSISTLLDVSMYIWCYRISQKELEAQGIQWHFSKELLNNIRTNYLYVQQHDLSPLEKQTQKEAYFDYRELVDNNFKQLKERFGLDLLKNDDNNK